MTDFMGITIVQKSDLKRKAVKAKKALILAGGAVTGGSFKAGGIKALADYMPAYKITNFDIFVGISSGSIIAAPLSAGIPPRSILRSLDGTSSHFTALHSLHFYQLNFEELLSRPLSFALKLGLTLPGKVLKAVSSSGAWLLPFVNGLNDFLKKPNIASYEQMLSPLKQSVGGFDFPALTSLLPSGIFDNSTLERYLRFNIERNHLTNDFKDAYKKTKKQLYICAMTVDGAKRVVFGHDEKSDVSISQAVMASTAMPGFYKPARIDGIDYVDGGVQETANIDVAVKKGAELIVCYNPFRPYQPEGFVENFSKAKRQKQLSDNGIMAVLNQIFRAFFYARLHGALEQFKVDPEFNGDIILIEPKSDDADFFMLNPLSMENRVKAAQLGFESVHDSITENYDDMKQVLAKYGIKMDRKQVDREYKTMMRKNVSEQKVQELLEERG